MMDENLIIVVINRPLGRATRWGSHTRIPWVINLNSNVHRRRYRLSIAKMTFLSILTMRLLEKLGQVLLPQARRVVLITHMRDGSASIHLARPGATRWIARIAIGSRRLVRHRTTDPSWNILAHAMRNEMEARSSKTRGRGVHFLSLPVDNHHLIGYTSF